MTSTYGFTNHGLRRERAVQVASCSARLVFNSIALTLGFSLDVIPVPYTAVRGASCNRSKLYSSRLHAFLLETSIINCKSQRVLLHSASTLDVDAVLFPNI